MSILAFILFGSLTIPASAQDAPPVVKLAGITQFIDGAAEKTESADAKVTLAYQTPLFEGDRIAMKSGAVLKFVSRRGCLIVTRGEGSLLIPTGGKAWRLRADSVRLICKDRSKAETIGIGSVPVSIQNGEVLFFDKNKIILLDGSASAFNQPLELKQLSVVRAKSVLISEPQPTEDELRALNLEQMPPREAYVWPVPEPVSTTRILFGPYLAAEHVYFDASNDNQKGLSGTGPRLQLNFQRKSGRSLIVAVTYLETKDSNRQGSSTSLPPDGVSNTVERELLEVGFRNSHDRWWSPFWRVGIGASKVAISTSSSLTNTSSYLIYRFYVVSATYGIDAHITPRWLKPFGAFVSGEGQVIESIGRGSAPDHNIPSVEPWRLTTLNLGMNLGVQYEF